MNRKGFTPVVLLVVIAVIIVAALVAWYVAANSRPNQNSLQLSPVACTQEAKQCPDGSYVSRTGPDCAFAACPSDASSTTAIVTTSTNATSSAVDISNWKTYTNQEYGYSFQYPSFMQDITESDSSSPLCELSDGKSISCFEYPPQELPGVVQFAGGTFVVNITDATSSQACDDFSDEGWGALPAATSSIDGVEFYSGGNPGGSSGAGFTEEGIEYRTYHNSMCYDLQANIGTDRCDGTETTDSKTKISYCDGLPELSDSSENMVYDILNQVIFTFQFTSSTQGAFCGGIATGAFPCPTGYSCQLNGTYPDAGGHCVKK